MPAARVEVRPAFSFIEALNYQARQRSIVVDAMMGRRALDDVSKQANDLGNLVSAIAHAMWVPKSMSEGSAQRVAEVLQSRPLVLVRDKFGRDVEQLYSASTAAAQSNIRERVMHDWCAGYDAVTDDSQGLTDLSLFIEMCREGIVDWAANATRLNYEVRRCGWCGTWYEPQLSGRSRFCRTRCRQEFNNARLSTQEKVRSFECDVCGERRPLEEYSGLHRTEDPWKIDSPISTALYISHFNVPEPVCVGCVRTHYPEWTKYIAPIDTKRDAA